jgi:multimeric flavodoxin WrbA
MSKTLLIIWHSMTGGSAALANAAASGASSNPDIAVMCLAADEAGPDDLLLADGYIFAFPENLAAISGGMKAFFDRSYYPCLGQIAGRPYALMVCAGSDGSNAVRQAERIAKGWRLRKIANSLIVNTNAQSPEAILAPKIIPKTDLAMAYDLGRSMAEGLLLGVF